MISKTKRTLSQKEINNMVKKAFGQDSEMTDCSQLTDGYFNNSYKIILDSGEIVVLKVAPKQSVEVLTYEKHLMATEVAAMEMMTKRQLPVPMVLFYDDSMKLIDSEYFFMTYFEGIPLNKVKDQIPSEKLSGLTKEIASNMSTLLSVPYKYFGEVGNKDKQFTTWFDCFSHMIADLMNDAARINLLLSIDKKTALTIIKSYQAELSQVKNSVLVHKDLWDGNIFVDKSSYDLVGIIDSERAILGDPLMEIVCGHYHHNPTFIEAYLGRKDLNPSENSRLLLYLLYINLLMVIECPYREYPNDNQFNWASEQLRLTLEKLNT